jgi:hypothetical protein
MLAELETVTAAMLAHDAGIEELLEHSQRRAHLCSKIADCGELTPAIAPRLQAVLEAGERLVSRIAEVRQALEEERASLDQHAQFAEEAARTVSPQSGALNLKA